MSSEFQRVQIDPHYQVYSRITPLRRTPWQQVYADIADLQARVSELEGQTMLPIAKPDFMAMLRQEVKRQLNATTSAEPDTTTPDQTTEESPPPGPTDTSPERQAKHQLVWQVIA